MNIGFQKFCSLLTLLHKKLLFFTDVFPMPLRPSYDLNSLPRTEADTTSCVPSHLQFTTNKANCFENNQLLEIQKFLTGESSSKENDKQGDFFMSTGDVAIHKPGGELLQSIVESASAGISTPYKENKDSDHESDRGIDLNQTPQQKPPKRRKHRPKVIIEGKPKRTPKLATPKNTEPKESRTGKRKYVRKNIEKESSSQLADGASETTYHNAGIGAKSCRRVLDFDLEKTKDEKQGKSVAQQDKMQQGNMRTSDLTFGFQGTHMATRTNHVSKMKSAELIDLENEVMVENQILGTMSHPKPSMNHMPSNYIIPPEVQESAAPLATRGDRQLKNLHVIKRHVDSGYEYAPMPQHSHAEGIGKHAIRANTNGENHEKTKESVSQGACQSALKALAPPNEGRGSKREYCHNIQQTHLCTNNPPSSLLCQETFELDGHQETSGTISKERHKKQKVDNRYLSIHDMPCNVTTVEECLGRVERKRANVAKSSGFAAALNHTILNSYIGSNRMSERDNNGIKCTSDRFIESIDSGHSLPKQQVPFKSNSFQEITQGLSFSTNSTIETCNQLVSSPPRKSSQREKRQVLQTQEPKSAKKQTVGSTALESTLSSTDKMLQEQDSLYDHQQSSAKTLGTFHLKNPVKSLFKLIIFH